MKIEQTSMLDFLARPAVRFAVPVFQRVYSWNARQCEDLWDDCLKAGKTGEAHFMGLVLYAPDADGGGVLDVIDGQQRLTTLSLLIAALDRRDLAAQCLLSFDRSGAEARGKLVLSSFDAPTLFAIVGAGEMPEEPASRLMENYLLFREKVANELDDPETLLRGLRSLEVAAVELSSEDSPQIVFESLNSKGMPLDIADRLRNLIVTCEAGDAQPGLFKTRWLPLEQRAANAEPPATAAGLLLAWLAKSCRSTRIFDESEAYGVLKRRLSDEFDGSLERLFDDLETYAEHYFSDPALREEDDASADFWIAGKPNELISEYKLFGN